ncbi:T9SS C-terminal target domain-containing protein, partial [Parabacteroides merdae]
MKKEVIHFVQYVLVKILFFGAAYPLQAQVSNPSSWESFVGSDENRLISDTLRLQTFGDSEWDNWGYTLTVNSSL